MHPHLHTKHNGACEELMNALDECQSVNYSLAHFYICKFKINLSDFGSAKGFLWKAVGMCNNDKTALNKCLREQRLLRTKANREAANIKNKKIRELWDDIDANS
ncbi:putative cytochrome c oxidase biogenesis protein cmc1-like protein [Golovinomyces cichoracearum]|uniref:COX assembly mitochondrial protein n=1 Tax=Golovinomyces cichoracearum TaxID=62708 RepID=A0A420IA82_9PEZI|nr:putative cytochrome c oxidase biogenesis protein cmc1-like protein [Golovinomyces cichoracearum]